MMAEAEQFFFDGVAVPIQPGDSVLVALRRCGVHPTGGGVLCAAGDCANCVVQIDGVAYVRSCQTSAVEGLLVESHPADGPPEMPIVIGHRSAAAAATAVRNEHCDVVVIGAGSSGIVAAEQARRGGAIVRVFDAVDGEEVIGVYPGPMVAARTDVGMVHAHCDKVVVATGRAEIVGVCPGSELDGILTPTAERVFAAAGVDLGTVVHLSHLPARIHGETRVTGVEPENGADVIDCDTVVFDLGTTPRDGLARMAGDGEVDLVGSAAGGASLPPCPVAGVVCPCNDTSVADLQIAWDRGFRDMELFKRATLAGTGTCQGSMCSPYLKSFLLDRGGDMQPTFTARPVVRQLTLGEVAAGRDHPIVPRTALDSTHRSAGATMDRIGGWWRPWTYGGVEAECHAVREAVSIGDVGTLAKLYVSGPDAEVALQRLFPTDVSTIRPGRSRYVLMLDERGYVLDDGMIFREPSGDRFYLTLTSGGADMAEMWVRDWTADLDVRWMNVTMSFGAINVTGPKAKELMERAGFDQSLAMLAHVETDVAGVRCRVARLSFTGEVSFELHHPAAESVALWSSLLELGDDLDILAHGLDALTRLRLEKGHIIVGQDTDYDTTPRRINHEWAVRMDKSEFVGRTALERTNRIALDKQLVGFEIDGPSPAEGAVLWRGDQYAGYVTSTTWSETLQRSVLLAWLFLVDGELPLEVDVDGATARRVPVPFLDPEGNRARA